jgi:MraZ protein
MGRESMAPFTGHRDHRIDGKDRVVIPSNFASVIEEEAGGRLYLVPGEDVPCLEAYPGHVFDEMAGEEVPNRFEGDQQRRRRFFQNAEEVRLKGPGRITLQRRFIEKYFRAGVVRVAGMNNYLELWDPDTWEAHVGDGGQRPPTPGSGALTS